METRRILLYRGVCGNNKISIAIASSKIVVKLNFEEFENTHVRYLSRRKFNLFQVRSRCFVI